MTETDGDLATMLVVDGNTEDAWDLLEPLIAGTPAKGAVRALVGQSKRLHTVHGWIRDRIALLNPDYAASEITFLARLAAECEET